MRDSPNWETLSDSQKEALEMDAHKIGRILNGDPNYVDSWHDVVGYTSLVEKELNEKTYKPGEIILVRPGEKRVMF